MTSAAGVSATGQQGQGLAVASAVGRWVLLATVLGSAVTATDATVVGIALPAIGTEFGTGLAALQWVVTAYTLTLAGFLLTAGALGDRFGRRRVFVIGVLWFAVASLLCGIAPNAPSLIAARALQGIGGALLMPGSLAILQASFTPGDRGRAIGAWSGLGGVATAVGPFLGGWLVQAASWRLIFYINLPIAIAVAAIAARHVPESRDATAPGRVDLPGGVLVTLGLVGLTFGLIEGPALGWGFPGVLGAPACGVVLLAVFAWHERRADHPMLPVDTFASSPVRSGALAARIGPRLQMSIGPVLIGAGLALAARIGPGGSYLTEVLPGVVVFGLGLAATVAPLTSTALAAAPTQHASIASAINNDVARVAGLIAVAVLPAAAGITGYAYQHPVAFDRGFTTAVLLAGAICALGCLAAITIRNPSREPASPGRPCFSCAVDASALITSTEGR